MESEGGRVGSREGVGRPVDGVIWGGFGKNEEGHDITPLSSLEPHESGDHMLKWRSHV